MTKIIFLLRDLEVGGGQKSTVSLINNLDRSLFEVFAVVLENSGPLAAELADDVHVSVLKGSQGTAIHFIPGLINQSNKLKKIVRAIQPQVVVGTNWFLNLIAAFIIKDLHEINSRLILINHNPVRDLLLRSTCLNLFVPVKIFVTRLLFGRADTIVAISDEMHNELKTYLKLSNVNIVTIYNGVSYENIVCLGKQHAGEINIAVPYIIFVGRLEYEKGCDLLIEAFASIAGQLPHSLVIVGAGSMRSQLESLIKRKNLSGRVIFTGELLNPYPLMKYADIFVLSSRWDAFPYVLLESLALELPIIATESEGSKKILGNGNFGLLVKLGDSSRLADAILHLAMNPALRDSFSINGLSRARNFSLSIMIMKYEELFMEV